MRIPIRLAACLLPVLAACQGGHDAGADVSGPAAGRSPTRAGACSPWGWARRRGRPRRCSRIPSPRAHVLRDSRPGVGVLVQADEPVPHLFVLRGSDLSRLPEP